MNADDVIRAFGLPASAMQRRPIPKEVIAKQVTGSDRRAVLDGLRSLLWVAVLKPGSVAIPAFNDGIRDYGEILVLRATLRPGVAVARVVGPIHRAVSYPTAVVAESDGGVSLSFAHVRRHERKHDAVVLDGDVRLVPLRDEQVDGQFLASLPVTASAGTHLHGLYSGWVERAEALAVSRVTGAFHAPDGPEAAELRRERFHAVLALEEAIATHVRMANRTRAVAERVRLNNAITALRERRAELVAMLRAS